MGVPVAMLESAVDAVGSVHSAIDRRIPCFSK